MAKTLGGLTLPELTVPYLDEPVTMESDNTTLDNTMYTDFVNNKHKWTLNWAVLDTVDYDAIHAIWQDQYDTNTYPTFVDDELAVNKKVRVIISARDIRRSACEAHGVQLTLIEQEA